MDFGDLSENPFAAQAAGASKPKRPALAAAVKVLLFVAVALSLTLVVQRASRQWLAHRLTDDFDSLDSGQKQARLVQLADFGTVGIEPMVRSLAEDDLEVARTAYHLLVKAQNDWAVLPAEQRAERHLAMVRALESIAVQLPDNRTGWGTRLLQQTLMTAINRQDDTSQLLYREATHGLEMLSLSDLAGPSILSDQPLDPMAPRRLTVLAEPLPVSSVGSTSHWTDWPPPRARNVTAQLNETDAPQPSSARWTGGAQPDPDANPPVETPSVYRSSAAPLQPVGQDEVVILRDIQQPSETAETDADEIRAVTHLVDSPMETFDDNSVIHWLASPHRTLRDKAKQELISRGYDDSKLAIASQIASGDTKTRMELVDAIARSGSIDPRPWLLMMLGDESRDVKLRVISVLATMDDPSVSGRLRRHLAGERDPTVAARIRRVLDLR